MRFRRNTYKQNCRAMYFSKRMADLAEIERQRVLAVERAELAAKHEAAARQAAEVCLMMGIVDGCAREDGV